MKGYKHLTAEQQAAILAEYERTKLVTLTAETLGVTQHQVRHLLKGRGVQLTGAQERGACWQHRDLIARLASEGASLSEMSRQVGANRRHLKRFLDRYHIAYQEFRQEGPNNPAWRGGRVIDQDGYVLVKQKGHPHADRHGYVREHRLVMERELGRYLDPSEIVHHNDGDRGNNDPANLEVFASNQEHLSQTLAGRIPEWTDEGRQRMREGARAARARQGSNRAA